MRMRARALLGNPTGKGKRINSYIEQLAQHEWAEDSRGHQGKPISVILWKKVLEHYEGMGPDQFRRDWVEVDNETWGPPRRT
jgi:hypothetical protein